MLDAARRLGVDVDSVCGGRGICGRCQVVPTFGSFAKFAVSSSPDHLSAPGSVETTDYKPRRRLAEGARLGCAALIQGDLVIDVPAASQVHKPVVRKSVNLDGLVVDPTVRLHYVELPTTELGEERSDLRLLQDALVEQWSLTTSGITPAALVALQPALAKGKRTITVAVHSGTRVTAVWPGFVDAAYGVAIDVGSTTVAGHLCDVTTGEVVASAGRMNPQIRFGEDLMSRVSYVMMNPGGEVELTATIRQALDELVGELVEQAAVTRDNVVDFVFVGNPIMHHLVLGIDPTPLGVAPFALATDLPVNGMAGEIGVDARFATFHALPCIAGHVGADTAGAILNERPYEADHHVLLIDVGTNAEIVLGDRNGLLAASSPTGPAFEGAQISCGQRATAGAIERVRIDRATLEPRFKVIGADMWSDEPGFAEATAKTGVTGVCGSGIIEVVAEMFLAGIIEHDGTISGSTGSPRVVADGRTFSYVLFGPLDATPDEQLRIAQNDVRAIQLAKGALYAGCRLLMEHAGIEAVDEVLLAGAFGSHIDPVYALVLGLVPDCDPTKVRAVGNSAGSGAARALLSAHQRAEIAAVARQVTKIETAIEPRFQEHFVGAMGIPHATDPYPQLAAMVQLPVRRPAADRSDRPRRRSR